MDDADLSSTACVTIVTIRAEVNAAISRTGISSMENRLVRISKPVRKMVEKASRTEETLRDGRRKRFLYLLASCSVDESYS